MPVYLGSGLVLLIHDFNHGPLKHSFVISRSSGMSVHSVPLSFKDVKVLLRCLLGILGSHVHFDRAFENGHGSLITLPHVMHDVVYHA